MQFYYAVLRYVQMIKYLTPIAAALLLTTGVANAGAVKSANQAATVCKAHLKSNLDGYKRAKLGKVRSSRASHIITFAVTSDAGRSNTKCVVNKEDGTIELMN